VTAGPGGERGEEAGRADRDPDGRVCTCSRMLARGRLIDACVAVLLTFEGAAQTERAAQTEKADGRLPLNRGCRARD
jgi:hypothetical protein